MKETNYYLVESGKDENSITHLDSHHGGRNSLKRLLHLVSTKVRKEICSTSFDSSESFFLTGKTTGLGSKCISVVELE